MNRLKAVLAPASPAGPRSRRIVVGVAAVIAGIAGAGSLAVAAHRQPILTETPAADIADSRQPAVEPSTSPRPAGLATTATPPRPAPAPVAAAAPRPQPTAETPAEAAARPSAPGMVQASPESAEITRVTWTRQPTPGYPAAAAANGVDSGTVTLSCIVNADGGASDCTVLTESPEGQGFGAAALASMENARFSPGTLAGAAPGATTRFTIRFRLAE